MSTGKAILDVFDTIKKRVYTSSQKIYIENTVFRLFSRITVAFLFLGCGLITLQQLIGEHIKCILPPKEDIREQALNQYCFIMSTYTVPHLYNKTPPLEIPHFGVGPHNPETDEQKYHSYYQWVPFVLFFQGIMFLVPHLLWKAYDHSRIKHYVWLELAAATQFKDRKLIDYTDKVWQQYGKAAEVFKGYMYCNHFYAGYYIFCEVLNVVIVIVNIFLTDAFLGYEFTTYGPEVFQFAFSDDPENRIDPMSRVFPKVTKCDFHKYGPSGNIIRYDIMCVLALNILNEKIYVVLWFWFIILAILGGLNLIYRLVALLVPRVRNNLILRQVPDQYSREAHFICNRLSYSDWFILKRIADNVNRIRLGDFCAALYKALNENENEMSIHSQSSDRIPQTSPPPTYDSSTLLAKDKDDTPEKNELKTFRNVYPSFSLESDEKEVEPLVGSRL